MDCHAIWLEYLTTIGDDYPLWKGTVGCVRQTLENEVWTGTNLHSLETMAVPAMVAYQMGAARGVRSAMDDTPGDPSEVHDARL